MESELDDETRKELAEAFEDLYIEIEEILSELDDAADDKTLNGLFRSIHTVKGNAGMFHLMNIVEFSHAMEDVAEAIRSKEISVSKKVCEALQLGMDRLRDLHERDLWGTTFENLQEDALRELFQKLGQASSLDADDRAEEILGLFGANAGMVDAECAQPEPEKIAGFEPDQYSDLVYFQQLSLQVDNQNQNWVGRTIQIFDWTQKLNTIGGSRVNYEQLAAATYLHDIGMAFVPLRIIEKKEKLTKREVELIQMHATVAYEYLHRINGWDHAALIVYQHHERVDGSGYPNGLKGDQICDGAKIIAIVDAFFSIVNGRADRAHRRSVVRAISEINARSGSQFDEYWVSCFNDMIKQENKAGNL